MLRTRKTGASASHCTTILCLWLCEIVENLLALVLQSYYATSAVALQFIQRDRECKLDESARLLHTNGGRKERSCPSRAYFNLISILVAFGNPARDHVLWAKQSLSHVLKEYCNQMRYIAT